MADSFKLCSWKTGGLRYCRPLLVDHADPTYVYGDAKHPLLCDGNEHGTEEEFDGGYNCSCADGPDSTELGSNCPPVQFARPSLLDADTAFLQVPREELDLTPIIEDLPGAF
jgi:hypothetical protein